MTVHDKVAEALGMAIPKEETTRDLVQVEPHEVKMVDNPEVPNITDLLIKLVQADKQREELITRGLSVFEDAFEQIDQLEPKYRGRALEVLSNLYGQVKDTIRDKSELQLKVIKLRLELKNYRGKTRSGDKPSSTKTTNYIFSGSQEELLKVLEVNKEPSATK